MDFSIDSDPLGLLSSNEIITEEKSLRLEGLVNDILDSDSPILPDLEYSDAEMPRYPNFIASCLALDGLNFPLFSRQAMMGVHLLGEWCPKCTPKQYHPLQGIPVDAPLREVPKMVVLLENGRCPKCKRSKRHLIKHAHLMPYSTLSACIGQRAGKSFTSLYILAYVTMQYLLLQNPLHALGLGTGSLLTGTCTAQTFSRALKLLWIPLRNILMRSPWFKQYNEIMKSHDDRYGANLLKITEEQILYGHRSILLYPSSPSPSTLRGDTRIWSVCVASCQLVSTGKGLRAMGSVAVGDRVLDAGAITPYRGVTKHWSNGVIPCVEVILKNGMRLVVTHKHLIKSTNASATRFMWIPAKDTCSSYVAVAVGQGIPKDLVSKGNLPKKLDNYVRLPATVLEAGEVDLRVLLDLTLIEGVYTHTSVTVLRELQLLLHQVGIESFIKDLTLSVYRDHLDRLDRWLTEGEIPENPHYIAVEVVSVNPLEQEYEVFDLTVDSHDHAFTVQGITVHNCDEVGQFPLEITTTSKTRDHANAKEVITSLDNSHLTVRNAVEKAWKAGYHYNIPLPPLLAISSPKDSRDRIMMMVRNSKTSRTNYGVHLPTWEVNPEYARDSTFIQERYRSNPQEAERDFGANPPKNSMPYIEVLRDALVAFDPKYANSLSKAVREKEGNSQYKEVHLVVSEILAGGIPQEYPALLALDAGIVKDSFTAVIMAKSGRANVDYDVLGMIEIIPDYKNRRNLNFTNIGDEIIAPIIDAFNVNTIVTDTWQHYKLLHDLEAKYNKAGAKRLQTISYSLKTQDMSAFRSVLSRTGKGSGSISIPAKEMLKHQSQHTKDLDPNDLVNGLYAPHVEDLDVLDDYPYYFDGHTALHLAYQCVYVRWDSKKILKSEGATDDLIRTMVLAQTVISSEDVATRLDKPLSGVNLGQQSNGFVGVSGAKVRGSMSTLGGSTIGHRGEAK